MKKNSHCSWCGTAFPTDQSWPRSCGSCRKITYLNPVPVAVCLIPIQNGLLCVRRAIEPQKGELALPGGFIDFQETWQQAAAREAEEETGLILDPQEITLFDVLSSEAGDGVVLIFGQAHNQDPEILSGFKPNEEISELAVIEESIELAFPLHTLAVQKYFSGRTEQ